MRIRPARPYKADRSYTPRHDRDIVDHDRDIVDPGAAEPVEAEHAGCLQDRVRVAQRCVRMAWSTISWSPSLPPFPGNPRGSIREVL